MERPGIQSLQRYVTGFAAASLSLFFIYQGGNNLSILFASAFFFLISLTDTIHSKIPNLFSFGLALLGLGYNAFDSGPSGLMFALGGLFLGLGLFIVPFLLGGMGAGDVKALAALGALLGPGAIFQVFLYTALFGGAMAIAHYLTNRNLLERFATWRMAVFAYAGSKETDCFQAVSSGEKLKFPYAAAIAFGYYAYLGWGTII